MNCTVCAKSGVTKPAVALCQKCLIALCEQHRTQADAYTVGGMKYGCPHQ